MQHPNQRHNEILHQMRKSPKTNNRPHPNTNTTINPRTKPTNKRKSRRSKNPTHNKSKTRQRRARRNQLPNRRLDSNHTGRICSDADKQPQRNKHRTKLGHNVTAHRSNHHNRRNLHSPNHTTPQTSTSTSTSTTPQHTITNQTNQQHRNNFTQYWRYLPKINHTS